MTSIDLLSYNPLIYQWVMLDMRSPKAYTFGMATPQALLIRMFREERGLKQKSFARSLRINAKVLSEIETGRRRLPTELEEKIVAALGLSPAEASRLREAGRKSSYVLRLPENASPLAVRLMHEFLDVVIKMDARGISRLREHLEGALSHRPAQ